ncbi:MAG: VCBS repeat-containing protein [Planctomycetaceae bacterium]
MNRTGRIRGVEFLLLHAGLWCVALCVSGCDSGDTPGGASGSSSAAGSGVSGLTFAELKRRDDRAADIGQFCGACHAVPLPQSFPKDAWYEEVRRGFDFYHQSGRTDLTAPLPQDVSAFYRDYAPVEFEIPELPANPSASVAFDVQEVSISVPSIRTPPSVSFVEIRPGSGGKPEIWYSDMRSGAAGQLAVTRASGADAADAAAVRISRNRIAHNPVAVRPVDLDGNGIDDLLFTDLGSYIPEDHDRGQLVRLPDGMGETPGTPEVLLGSAGRVADVCVADFTGDNLPDLIVAEFGWRKTGGIHLLTNQGLTNGQPVFSQQLIDKRAGTINIVPVDLDNNGTLDFVASISQEHEQIVAFLNAPDGFQPVVLYAAPDPSWGTSGIAMVDLDSDGDQDFLYTNGDTFDSNLVKPYHGIWWLENKGQLNAASAEAAAKASTEDGKQSNSWRDEPMPFEAHRLTAMPGVHRALPGDLDGDGDLDIVASALLPSKSARNTDPQKLDALIWLEQVRPGTYERHTIERGRPIYPAIAVTDLDSDNRLDIVAGCFYEDGDETQPLLKIFWNASESGGGSTGPAAAAVSASP